MKALFESELLRFRLWAAIAFVLHLGVLAATSRFVDLAQQPIFVYQVFAAGYLLVGVALGAYQLGSYRQPNRWLHLLHRPLDRLQIAGALGGAGTLLLVCAVTLPILLLGLYQEQFTARVVDARHYGLAVSAGLVATIGYAAGMFAMVADRRYSLAVFLLPNWLLYAQASGLGMIALQLLILAMIAGLVAIVFRPDPQALPRNAAAMLAVALPAQLAMYFLLWIAGYAYELGMNLAGTHPLSMTPPPKGGHVELERAGFPPYEQGAPLLLGLAGSKAPQAALWREQIALSDVHVLAPLRASPRRHTLTNPAPLEFEDADNGIHWVFSHDGMRFEGYGLGDRQPRGTLSVGDAAFPAPTLQSPTGWLYNTRAAYQYDGASRQVFERMRVPQGETLAAFPTPAGDNVQLLTDKALYVYSGLDIANGVDLLQPLVRVPLPGQVGNLSDVQLIELLDGYLVSFNLSWGVGGGELQQPEQHVVHVDGDERVTTVARRELKLDLPAWYSNRLWWLSPALRILCLQVQDLFASHDPLRAPPQSPSDGLMLLAAVGQVFALALAAWWTARRRIAGQRRWAWTVSSAVIGLPAFLALWWMTRHEELPITDADPMPAATGASPA